MEYHEVHVQVEEHVVGVGTDRDRQAADGACPYRAFRGGEPPCVGGFVEAAGLERPWV